MKTESPQQKKTHFPAHALYSTTFLDPSQSQPSQHECIKLKAKKLNH